MRITSLLISFAVLCSASLATVASATFDTGEHTSACAALQTCGSCISSPSCGFALDSHKCVAKEDRHHRLIATRPAQCSIAYSKLLARVTPSDATERLGAATAFWNKMREHVAVGGNTAKSGRHTTSSYFDPKAGHDSLIKSLSVDTMTSLAKVGKKTLFVDSVVQGSAETEHVTKWTEATMATACRFALQASLKEAGSTNKVVDGSYSVKSPLGGHNICVHVNAASCWPVQTTPTNVALGGKC